MKTLYMVWRGQGGDSQLWFSTLDGGDSWSPQQQAHGLLSDFGPAVAVCRHKLYLAFRGSKGIAYVPDPNSPGHSTVVQVQDPSVYWTTYYPGQSVWLQPYAAIPGLRSDRSPALAVFRDRLHVVAKGFGDDEQIWWADFDGLAWKYPTPITSTGGGTSNGPALAAFRGAGDSETSLYMAWRGTDTDQTVWWSSFDGSNPWLAQQPVAGAGTSNDPAMAVFRDVLYLVWNGGAGDSRIYWSTLDNASGNWTPKKIVPARDGPRPPGVGTNESPAIAVFQDRLYMAWKGVGEDNIWWNYFDGASWSSQQILADRGTASGPALAAYDPTLLGLVLTELHHWWWPWLRYSSV